MLARLDPVIRGVRWLPPESLHLTLSFLGTVDAPAQQKLLDVLRGVRVPAFFLPIAGVDVFGGERPTTIWAGVGRGHPHLFALHKRIQDAVLGAGLEPDLRPFRPHVTLGRAKQVPRSGVKPFLLRHEKTEFDLFRVTGFVLYSSVLSAEGAIYTAEGRAEF